MNETVIECGEDHYENGVACRQKRGHYCKSPFHDRDACDCVCHEGQRNVSAQLREMGRDPDYLEEVAAISRDFEGAEGQPA